MSNPEWTLIKDAWPPPDTRILVWCGTGTFAETAHTFSKWPHPSNPKGYLISGHKYSHNCVVAWMLAPEPPA